jgi:hypothetical protein
MLDDARLKAQLVVSDAKKAVNEVLPSVTDPVEAVPLEELRDCLDEIEEDLFVTALDQRIVELQAYQQRLYDVDARLKEIPRLRPVARKVDGAAKAIGVVVEVASKVTPPVI